MSLMSLLVALIVLCLVFWCVQQLAGAFGLPAPIVAVIQVLLVVCAVLWVLNAFGFPTGVRLR